VFKIAGNSLIAREIPPPLFFLPGLRLSWQILRRIEFCVFKLFIPTFTSHATVPLQIFDAETYHRASFDGFSVFQFGRSSFQASLLRRRAPYDTTFDFSSFSSVVISREWLQMFYFLSMSIKSPEGEREYFLPLSFSAGPFPSVGLHIPCVDPRLTFALRFRRNYCFPIAGDVSPEPTLFFLAGAWLSQMGECWCRYPFCQFLYI